jgi:hypothetical protein
MLLWSFLRCRYRYYLWWIRGSNSICWRAHLLIRIGSRPSRSGLWSLL